MDKPKVVVFCGSSRFVDRMAVAQWLVERDEQAIGMGLHLLPGWYSAESIPDHLAEHEGVAEAMDALHMRKIDMCDEIFVINYRDYLGNSTRNEIEYAKNKGKHIRWYTSDPIGREVDRLIQAALEREKEVKKKGEGAWADFEARW
jgi:hypothetical protein